MKLLIFLLAPVGLIGGLAAGHMSAPAPVEEVPHEEEPVADGAAPPSEAEVVSPAKHQPPSGPSEYAKIDKQFVVPIIAEGAVSALIVVNMAVEVDEGATDLVYLHEPKLRDEFLSVLFNHGRSGAFQGEFTDPRMLDELRATLNEAARRVIGKEARQVLLTSIIRQDM